MKRLLSQTVTALPTCASIAVGVVPIAVLIRWYGVPSKLILGWGILSYIIGVSVLKMPLYHFIVVKHLHPRLSNFWLGVTQGAVSAISELGAAFFFFLFVTRDMTFVQLTGFGVAAGAVEAVVIPIMGNPLQGTPLEQHAENLAQRASGRRLISWLGVLERILALMTHVAARGLVYLSASTGAVMPALLAVVSFAALDGRGYYAHLQRWAFDDPDVLARFYRYFAAIAFLQAGCFLLFYFVL